MKSIKKLPALFIALFLAIALNSCQQEVLTEQAQTNYDELLSQIPPGEDQGESKITQSDLDQYQDEALLHLNSLGVNLDNPIIEDVVRPDGSVEHVYVIGEDIEVSSETYKKLQQEQSNPSKQYHTNYLVSSPRTITVGVEFSGSGAVPAPIYPATVMAAANYNDLGNGLNFTVTPVLSVLPNTPDVDILIYYVPENSNTGARAGFSTNSNPYPYIQIYGGMASFLGNLDVLEHVITHEIGHCIGMRHTDWQTRSSCSSPEPESVGYGANHIAGTPTGYYTFFGFRSVMNACFTSSSTGEFDIFDRIALNTLY